MKVIALIPAKNEELLLPLCLESLQTVADEIVVYNDHSTDRTEEVAKEYGAVVISENYTSDSGWPEYEIRERLLLEARSRNATHVLSLDADEALTPSFAKIAREHLSKLQSGDTLSLRWITLWKNTDEERVDGVFENLYKDFAFCDDFKSHHQYAFLGVGRVPKPTESTCHTVPTELGGILHFQYAAWERTQIKQAWYRCSELIKGDRSARRINNVYSISLDGAHVKVKELPLDWIVNLPNIDKTTQKSSWHLETITTWFNEYGTEFFEPLQIWHIPELHKLFIEKTNREPVVKVFPNWLVHLNKIKNNLHARFS
jgi:glycosyltransferase involved in cell wall biosynthesis